MAIREEVIKQYATHAHNPISDFESLQDSLMFEGIETSKEEVASILGYI